MPLPIPLDKIQETEAALGVTLPALFKAQMSRSNGGEVEIDGEGWFLFPLRDTTSRETTRRSAGDIIHETKEALASDLGFPDDGIAIAENNGGDLLFLRRDGAVVRKEVWTFLHEGGELRQILDDVADLWDR
jgi:hypothetical protein